MVEKCFLTKGMQMIILLSGVCLCSYRRSKPGGKWLFLHFLVFWLN